MEYTGCEFVASASRLNVGERSRTQFICSTRYKVGDKIYINGPITPNDREYGMKVLAAAPERECTFMDGTIKDLHSVVGWVSLRGKGALFQGAKAPFLYLSYGPGGNRWKFLLTKPGDSHPMPLSTVFREGDRVRYIGVATHL